MDRRNFVRFMIDTEVDLQFIPGYGFMAARTCNLSTDGMFIETGTNDVLKYRIVRTKIWLRFQYLTRSVIVIGKIVRRSHNGFALHYRRSESIHNFLVNTIPDHPDIRQNVQ
ncbi:MAG: PilZ domain-containing protein [Gammaproteobacteria bacterium]|nr:PilZ domain-containing protein [Gammaproteobacteria bacterium]